MLHCRYYKNLAGFLACLLPPAAAISSSAAGEGAAPTDADAASSISKSIPLGVANGSALTLPVHTGADTIEKDGVPLSLSTSVDHVSGTTDAPS